MRWAGHEVRMEETKYKRRNAVENPEV